MPEDTVTKYKHFANYLTDEHLVSLLPARSIIPVIRRRPSVRVAGGWGSIRRCHVVVSRRREEGRVDMRGRWWASGRGTTHVRGWS